MHSVLAIEVHFWIATIGIVLYITAMWIAGVMQGLMWRAISDDGTLTYTFVESVKATYPYYVVRVVGGALYLFGMLIMLWNTLITIAKGSPSLILIPNYKLALGLYNYNTSMPTWVTTGQPWVGPSKSPAQTVSTENIYLKQMSINWATARNTVYLKPSIYNLYTTNDQRKKFFYNNSTANAIVAPGLPGQQRNSPTTYNWGPNLADLYLMSAECKARGADLVGAKADLEFFRASRMSATEAIVTSTTQAAIVKSVLDERLREFAGTGWRWFDMRRLSTDPVYNNIDGTHPLDGVTYTLKSERLTLKIPPAILKLNPTMVDNN
jgi:hypothetical protein